MDSLKVDDAVAFIRHLTSLSTDDRRKQESFVQNHKDTSQDQAIPHRYKNKSLKELQQVEKE